MTLELYLLIIETVLLVLTVVLLVFSIKEGRQRNALIDEIGRATRVLTRHEYFIAVVDAMKDAESEIIACITGRLPSGEDRKRTAEVILNIEKLTRAGVKVKYLLPKFQDRLHIGWLYSRAGAEVRYGGCPLILDFRYTIVDGKYSVIGLPDAVGEKEATRKGYRIPSEELSKIIKNYFLECWDGSIRYEDFLKETIGATQTTAATLAKELYIDEAEIRRIVGG